MSERIEGFGYWAGPVHEADGYGYPGPRYVVHTAGITHGIDDDWRTVYRYTRRRVPGEWSWW